MRKVNTLHTVDRHTLTFCGAEVLRLLGGGMNAHRTPAVIDQMGPLGNFDPQALWAPREMLKLF